LQIKQQQLVKELRERNDFIETVLYNLPIGILVNRSDNKKVTLINKQFSEIYDCTEDDLKDYSVFFKKVYPNKAYRDDLSAKIIHDAKEGDAAKLLFENVPLITSKGRKKIVNAKIIPLYDQNLMISTLTDVTDEYNQSNELKRIKANQDAIINGTENLVWSVDANLRIISANKRYVEFVKANAGQYISEGDKALFKGYGEERLARWRSYYERVLYGEILTFKEEIFDRRANRVQYGLVSLNPMYNTEGKIFGVSCNIKNVTDDTLNLIALERAKNDLEKTMNASLDIICTIDARGRFININAAAETILGYKPEELIGTSVYAIIHPDDSEKTKIASMGLIAGRDLVNFECRYVRKDGSIVYLTSSSKWDPNEQVSYGVARDVTERKKVEEALFDSEKKYKHLFENNPLPLIIWDFETLQIIDCNGEAEIKYGYTREEFLKLTIKDIRPPEDIPLIEALTKTESTYGAIHKNTWRHRKKNGEIMFVNINGHLVNFNGRRASLVLCEDITESHYYHELEKLERNILEMNTWAGSSLEKVLEVYLSGIESIHPGMLCSIQELRGTRLYNMASPGLPAAYLEAIEGVEAKNNVGSCGTAAFLKQRVIVSDISNDKKWAKYKEVAERFQLKACWSQPIIDSGGNVMATLASYFREIKTPSKSEENTIQRVAQILQLILESYQRELTLKISNERFQYVAAATSQVIWDWNLATNEVYFSENFEKSFGYPSGSSHYDENFFKNLVHPDDRENVMLSAAKVNYGQITNINNEYRFKKANGEYAFILDKALVIRDKNGVGIRMVGAMEDVTKQKQEEQRLKLLESVVTNSTDAVLITQAGSEDDPALRILYVNEAFTKMTGYLPEEVIGKTPAFLQGPKSSVSELNRLTEALRTWQPCEITTTNYKKNGEEFWINFTVVPVADENGSFTHWVVIQHDITQRQNEELQKELLLQISLIFKEDTGLSESINKAINRLMDYGNFSLVEFFLVDSDQKKANLIASVSETDEMQAFTKATDQIKYFLKGEGMQGTAWETKSIQEWRINDLNENFKRIEPAKKHGIKRAYALPIMNNDEVIGVLTLGMDRDEMPDFGFATMFDDFSKTFAIEIRRKQAEEELKHIFNFSPDILCIINTDGYFKKINPAMTVLLEYDEQELLARPFIELIHPLDKEETRNELQNIIYNTSSCYYENRFVTKSGKTKWLAWTTSGANTEGLIYCVAKDITEKKEFEDLLDKATKLARIGAWEADIDKGIIHWSDIMHEIHETEPDFQPDIKTALKFFIKGENYDKINQAMQDALINGTPADLELQIITAKGNIKWVRVIVEAELTGEKYWRLYGSFQDIDARKRAEVAVTEALEDKNTILESIGDAFFAVDKNWVVTYWNNMAEKVLHVPLNKILGHNLWEIFSDSTGSVSFKKYHEAVGTNQAVHFEDYYPALACWYEISAYPSETGLSVYFKDITEHKKIIAELVESEKKYSELFHLSPQPMWVFELNTLNFLDVNEAAIKHYGYSREEFLSMTIKDIKLSEDIPEMEIMIENHKTDASIHSLGINRHVKKNGEVINVDLQSNFIEYKGKKAKVIIASDITERLKYVTAIESQNEKLREISWIQSHIVRAPLARIIGLLPLVKDLKEHTEEREKMFEYLTISANELDDIIRDITDKTIVPDDKQSGK
ncbi:MAG: PAS domain S-box protein, partial [Sphingobacteriales bacterium]